MSLVIEVLYWITVLVVSYFLVLNGTYLLTSLLAFRQLRRYGARLKTLDLERLVASDGVPPVTLVAPAFNEEAGCVESVQALLSLRYPDVRVLVVNDGSKDRTLERLVQAFELAPAPRIRTSDLPSAPIREVYRSRRYPNLTVIDKENGGKADALNAGIAFCQTPLFCAMDADTLLERDALLRVVRPFLEDARTVAVGGILRIVNGCTVRRGEVIQVGLPANLLARFQVLEYLRAFLAGRMGWDALNATLIISGAFGLFRRSAVVAAGGYATDTVGEDMELVVRLHRTLREAKEPYRIRFVPDPVAWTECPERLRVLGRQRDRWQRGLAQTLVRHRSMLLNPRHGRVGMLSYPFFFFLEMLGPLIELLGYLALPILLLLGRVDLAFALVFLAVSVGLGMVLSLLAVALEELSFRRYPRRGDLWRLFGLALLENMGYRQLQAWWRLKGLWSALRRSEQWGAMERRGFGGEVSAPGTPAGPGNAPGRPRGGDDATPDERAGGSPGTTGRVGLLLLLAGLLPGSVSPLSGSPPVGSLGMGDLSTHGLSADSLPADSHGRPALPPSWNPAEASDTLPSPRRFSTVEVAGTRTAFRTPEGVPAPTSWTDLHLEGILRGGPGALVLRGTRGDRFGGTGHQFEVEGYPVLPGNRYAYLGLGGGGGYSEARFFPDLRVGGELFQAFGGGWEVSGGVRHLRFEERSVTLWTGSLAREGGGWIVVARPYLSTRSERPPASGGAVVPAPAEAPASPSSSFDPRLSGTLTLRRLAEGGAASLHLVGTVGETPDLEVPQDLDRRRALSIEGTGWVPLPWPADGSGGQGKATAPPPLRLRVEAGLGRERVVRPSGPDTSGEGTTARQLRIRVGFGLEVRLGG